MKHFFYDFPTKYFGLQEVYKFGSNKQNGILLYTCMCFFHRKLKAEKEDLIKSRNQLSADLERLLNQREVIITHE